MTTLNVVTRNPIIIIVESVHIGRIIYQYIIHRYNNSYTVLWYQVPGDHTVKNNNNKSSRISPQSTCHQTHISPTWHTYVPYQRYCGTCPTNSPRSSTPRQVPYVPWFYSICLAYQGLIFNCYFLYRNFLYLNSFHLHFVLVTVSGVITYQETNSIHQIINLLVITVCRSSPAACTCRRSLLGMQQLHVI